MTPTQRTPQAKSKRRKTGTPTPQTPTTAALDEDTRDDLFGASSAQAEHHLNDPDKATSDYINLPDKENHPRP